MALVGHSSPPYQRPQLKVGITSKFWKSQDSKAITDGPLLTDPSMIEGFMTRE